MSEFANSLKFIEQKVQRLKVALETEVEAQRISRDTGTMDELHTHKVKAQNLRVQIATLVELQIELGEQA